MMTLETTRDDTRKEQLVDEVMTVDQIDRTLSDDTDRLAQAERRLAEARGSFQHLVDHNRFGSAALHAATVEEARPKLEATEREAAELESAVERNARQALSQLERSRGSALTAEEMTRAAALREEIREDVERLDAVALRDRIVAALTAGDRAALHHLIRYVPLRGVSAPIGIPGEIEAQREMPRLID